MSKEEQQVMVSVHCFVYNHEPYIRQCLDGFIMQKTNFKYDVIVHDDASTDGSRAIIEEYEKKFPEIIKPIYEIENKYSVGGFELIHSIMRKESKGKYIALCEADDYWTDPYKLQKQVDFLENNPDYSSSAHQSTCIGALTGLFYDGVPEKIEMKDLVSKSRLFHTASFVYRSNQLFNLPPMTHPYVSGDKLLFLKAALFGPIGFMNESMCVYRKHSTGMSTVVHLKDLKKDLNIIDYMVSIDHNFPKLRYKSFLYGTFALYPTDISWPQRLYYLFASFVLSFSYFPRNIVEIVAKILRVNRIEKVKKEKK